MGRKYGRGPAADHLNATVTSQADRAVVRSFKATAKENGLSIQRALLHACASYIKASK